MVVNQQLLVFYVLGIKQATNVEQLGFPQSRGFRKGLTISSELPVHRVLALVWVQLYGSDRGTVHKAIYPRVSVETQGMYITICKYLWVCLCL